MAMHNPKGRANYEPNSWGADDGGPRASLERGYKTPAEEAEGPKLRMRPESFADHYSQARQFYVSQTDIEQQHMVNALVFELSKCEVEAIRVRMVSHLMNIDETLAQKVAEDLGIEDMPDAAPPAAPVKKNLKASDALSILKNAPGTFKGRKLGILLSDHFDAKLLKAVKASAKEEGAVVELIGPRIAGVKADDGSTMDLDHKIDGGPSVIFDAVAILMSDIGKDAMMKMPPARDFVADAYAHYKFVAYTDASKDLFKKAGLPDDLDGGFHALTSENTDDFIKLCRDLRFWDRPDGA